MKKGSSIIGTILVSVGLIILLDSLNIINIYKYFDPRLLFNKYWPSILFILPGLIFHFTFFTSGRRNPSILIPGGILVISGLTIQISKFYSLSLFHKMWPGFILSIAVGLFERYIFGSRIKTSLIPIGILGGLSVFLFSKTLYNYDIKKFVIPAVMIFIGFGMIFGNKFNKK